MSGAGAGATVGAGAAPPGVPRRHHAAVGAARDAGGSSSAAPGAVPQLPAYSQERAPPMTSLPGGPAGGTVVATRGRTTLIRVKRKRTADPVDTLVVESTLARATKSSRRSLMDTLAAKLASTGTGGAVPAGGVAAGGASAKTLVAGAGTSAGAGAQVVSSAAGGEQQGSTATAGARGAGNKGDTAGAAADTAPGKQT